MDTELININDVVAKHNVTVDDFVECMKGGLSATKDIKDIDGEFIDSVPDWNVRHKFFATGLELLGYLRGNGTNITNNIISAEAKKMNEEFKEFHKQHRLGN